ncbi:MULTISPECIES: ABC transporter permease subunit [Brenneria]|uniref:ABC transporter permease subunit n=1 Tax=Brenneria nigrifluens DSM 30175 = ATCC 13028 TaxID=1121120 RepID=A0A2U1UVH3_9GAMM|nr:MULTISPECIES: ABC transporter permease subunit [Brenneria]EHD20227.1 polar amino acid ABC transporter, inner membrane subunit [Brenneria sp. EniD312]PWC25684.1 amino acid ABC transporter permease [Brenneria nigrifluens DSM 30175 = ATCC 13028]QCR03451.1 ABC transporter permease subunit [Brenneria nigrifluens DSM 30175 = ATCC 13028]
MNNAVINVDEIFIIIPKLLHNMDVTLYISIVSLLISLLGGLFFVALQEQKNRTIQKIVTGYLDVMRGSPLILLILLFFYGGKLILSELGISPQAISDNVFAILSISASMSAYFAEMMRSAYHAVDQGQKEAISSLNIPPFLGLIRIIFPQGLIIAIPNLGNLLINIVKMTSLINIIGIIDIFGRAQKISQNSYGVKQAEAFISVVLIYWAINVLIFAVMKALEKRYRHILN